MSTIDAAAVKKLREMTGAGIMDCKSALAEAGGDFNEATTILRKKGGDRAGGKAHRATGEGSLGLAVSEDGKKAALVELNCETDFVAKNEKFQQLCREVAEAALSAGNVTDAESLQSVALPSGASVEQTIKESIGTIGENIKLGRVARFESTGVIGHYQHHDHKQAAIVELDVEGANLGGEALQQLGREISMQIVTMKPQYVTRDEIPADVLQAEKNIYAQQAASEGKPEAIQQKIAEGRLNKEFLQTVCLMDQAFIKEQKQTVAARVDEVSKSLGAKVRVAKFARFKVGEA